MLRDAAELLVLLGGEFPDDALLFSRRVGECRVGDCGCGGEFGDCNVDILHVVGIRRLFLGLERGESRFDFA